MSGYWEVVGRTGKLKGLSGVEAVRIKLPSPKECQWLFVGDLTQAYRSGEHRGRGQQGSI